MACICRGFIHTDLGSPITYGTTTVSQPVSHLLLFHACGGPNRSCEINERRRGVMGGRGWLQSHVPCRNQGVPRHLIRRLCLVQCAPRFTSCIVTAGEMVRQGQISKPWGASLRARGGGWRSEAVRISQSDRWPYRWPLSVRDWSNRYRKRVWQVGRRNEETLSNNSIISLLRTSRLWY